MAEQNIPNLEEMLKGYDITPEELEVIKVQNDRETFSPDTLKAFITQIRKDQALANSKKDASELSCEDISKTWDNVKDAQDEESIKAKEEMLKKSEEQMNNVDLNNPDMSTAAEFKEWLSINNSQKNLSDEQRARNEKIGTTLDAYITQYDKDNGLDKITKENAAQIAASMEQISEAHKDIDPFALDENGQMKNPEFQNAANFYGNMNIKDKNGKEVSAQERAELLINTINIARQEAIQELALDPQYAAAEDKNKYFKEVMAGKLEQGAVSIVLAEVTIKGGNNPQNKEELTQRITNLYKSYAQGGDKLVISKEAIEASHAARTQNIENIQKRTAQKTGKWSLFKKPEWVKNFQQKHPKLCAGLKIAGSIGLTAGTAMIGGAAGLAALGAYRTIKKIRDAISDYNKTDKQESFMKYLWSSKKLIGIASTAAGAVFAGYGAIEIGGAANGMLGNLGVEGTASALKTMVGNAGDAIVNAVQHPIDTVGSLANGAWNLGKRAVESISSGNAFNSAGVNGELGGTAQKLAQHRMGRLYIAGATTVATLGQDLADDIKSTKGMGFKARAKAIGKSFGKALGMTAITVGAYELGQSAHSGGAEVDGASNSPEIDASATEVKDFDEVFQGQTEQNLTNACNRAPSSVIEDLQEKGILPEDYKLVSSRKLIEDINNIYETNDKLNPQELADFMNNQENQDRYLADMKAYNEAQLAKQMAEEIKLENIDLPPLEMPNLDIPMPDIEIPQTIDPIEIETPRDIDPDVLDGDKGENSLKEELNYARKSDTLTVDNAIKEYLGNQIGQGQLSLKEAEELELLIKQELLREGDGNSNLDELSRGDVRKGVNSVKEILTSINENTDEINIAENHANNSAQTTINTEFESFSHDTETAQFYKGMSNVLKDMQDSDKNISQTFAQAVQEGRLSETQYTAMNLRYSELQSQGLNNREILEQMGKDYDNHTKFFEAQETSAQPETNSQLSQEEKAQEPNETKQRIEEARNRLNGRDNSEDIAKQIDASKQDFEARLDAKIEEASTIGLDKSENLQDSQIIMAKDKLGNMQFVGKDENGNAFKLTIIHDYGPEVQETGTFYKVDLPEGSPLAKTLDIDTSNMSRFDANMASMNESINQRNFADKIVKGIKNSDYTLVDSNGFAQNVSPNSNSGKSM